MISFKFHEIQIILIIWLFGFVIGYSQFYAIESIPFTFENNVTFYDCKKRWPPGHSTGQLLTLFYFVIIFIIPILVINVVYSLVINKLHRQPTLSQSEIFHSERFRRNFLRKKYKVNSFHKLHKFNS